MRVGPRKPGVSSFLALLLIAVLVSAGDSGRLANAQSDAQGIAGSDPTVQNRHVHILPQIELLGAVQSQTPFLDTFGPKGEGNEYFRAVKVLMEPYKDHVAVQISKRLMNGGFGFSWPVGFMLHLGPLPDLEPVTEYPDDMVAQAGGKQNLEEFRLALKDLAEKSKFLEFFNSWQGTYDRWVAAQSAGIDFEKVTNWLSDFFGWSSGGFEVVLAPAMFQAGYGPTVKYRDGTVTAYEVICSNATSTLDPVFPSAGTDVERLSLHEIGHSFVNPIFAEYPDRVQGYEPLYRKVGAQMNSQYYGQVWIFFNEQVIRGVVALAARDLYGEAAFESEIEANEDDGFYLTGYIADQMADYAANRSKYPKFTDFVPVLLDRIDEGPLQDALVSRRWATGLGIGGAVVSVCALVFFIRRRRAMRRAF